MDPITGALLFMAVAQVGFGVSQSNAAAKQQMREKARLERERINQVYMEAGARAQRLSMAQSLRREPSDGFLGNQLSQVKPPTPPQPPSVLGQAFGSNGGNGGSATSGTF